MVPSQFEAMDGWASSTFANPVNVRYRGLHKVLFPCIVIFLSGISLLMIVANGFVSTSILLLVLNGALLIALYYILRRAWRRSVYSFDLFGVTRGDKQRLSWNDLKSVDYLMPLTKGGAEENLWRIELVFTTGEAWLIPQRIKNLEEINDLVNSLPVAHQKRPA
jgi:hypothetical protein